MIKKEYEERLEEFLLEETNDEKSKRTIEHYRSVLLEFLSYLKEGEVRKQDIILYKEKMQEKHKTSTINHYIVIVNKFMKFVDMKHKNQDASWIDIRKHRCDMTLKHIRTQHNFSLDEILEEADAIRMLNKAKKDGEMDLHFIIKIFMYTGIRVSELQYFTADAIKSNYIEVKNKGKIRNIILRNDLKSDLIAYAKERNLKGHLFPGKGKSKMMDVSTIFKRLKRLAGKCRGINKSKVHPHAFRHLFAITFLSSGGTIPELKDILGHTSVNTTMIYLETTDFMKKQRLEKMKYRRKK